MCRAGHRRAATAAARSHGQAGRHLRCSGERAVADACAAGVPSARPAAPWNNPTHPAASITAGLEGRRPGRAAYKYTDKASAQDMCTQSSNEVSGVWPEVPDSVSGTYSLTILHSSSVQICACLMLKFRSGLSSRTGRRLS